MPVEKIHALVVGGGQAGIAMSEHLTRNNVAHVVLEKGRIAERWRSMRWDSLVANGPAWHDRFPNLNFPGNADAFVSKEGVADYFEAYAKKYNAPIRCGTEVTQVERLGGRPGFRVETSNGVIEARYVVVATGPFQLPNIPPIVPPIANINQIHSSEYRNPHQFGEGAALVIGAGSSGVQIAEELMRVGRKTYLSVGPHDRPPRAYRGYDCAWWLGVLGKWDAQVKELPTSNHVTVAVSGARGGETIDFRRLAARGMILVGMTESFKNGKLSFAEDLANNLDRGDQTYLSLLDEADAFVVLNGLNLPQEPEARILGPTADCITNPILELDLTAAGITTIIWATGFRSDYSWLKVQAFDDAGRPRHQRGVSSERGLYFLGLPGLSGRASSFIWGVWHDAKHLADHITIQDNYLACMPQA
ncbi:flavin-containing monooxygenase [Agrobacterium vitis]|uniref:flavin-containing monooxygenase n=1 Tax=Agrobacterium vitis TaxID=373 RepID=UPI0015748CE6|nr:NAD(P)/FAD-dependent oxidoreductase [Agrobacterium vitis]NSZ20059.1 NAD(P)-binding domain-containing protein [Agrobacterium vitis]QZO07488.1 NAD(P)/FAD-dependent oxidoreductase [Agrobacterium vitis]UJL90682.1 NAD(P)-binding domain-containing protein [Agrobacterium vitis]